MQIKLTEQELKQAVEQGEKAAAQAIPAIGAAGGAIINTIFMDHFQDMARGHFIVRKLERKHGKKVIETCMLNSLNLADNFFKPFLML